MSKMFNSNKQKSFFASKKELLVDGCCVEPVCCGTPNVHINYNLFSKGNKLFNKQQTLFSSDGCCIAHNDPCCVSCICNDTNYELLYNVNNVLPYLPISSSITLSLSADLSIDGLLNIYFNNTDDTCISTINSTVATSTDPTNILISTSGIYPLNVLAQTSTTLVRISILQTILEGVYNVSIEYDLCGQSITINLELNIVP